MLVNFLKDKETKRTFRYVAEPNKNGVSGSLYLPKEGNESVEVITVSIESAKPVTVLAN